MDTRRCEACGEMREIPSRTPQGEWVCLSCLRVIAEDPDLREAVTAEIEAIYGKEMAEEE